MSLCTIDEWNAKVAEEHGPVMYFPVLPWRPGEKCTMTTTRSPAFDARGHGPAVFLFGIAGYVDLAHCLPYPLEPTP